MVQIEVLTKTVTDMQEKLSRFLNQWRFDRSMTLDLLRSLSDEELGWSPGAEVGPFWKQFRHIGRVQENYMEALDTGSVTFSPRGSYNGTANGAALVAYLESLDKQLEQQLAETDENKLIDWFGEEKITAFDHMLRMMGHETLHHGEWIVCCRLMKKTFPKSWSIWGF